MKPTQINTVQKLILTGIVLILSGILCFAQDRGGKISYMEQLLPKALDPYSVTDDLSNIRITSMLYQSLFSYNKLNQPVAILADTIMQTSPDKFIIKLKKGIKYSDGGEFQAADVISTIKAIQQSNKSWKEVVAKFQSVQEIDVSTIQLVLKTPDFQENVEKMLMFKILPYYKLQELPLTPQSDIAKIPVGSGPFKYNSKTYSGLSLKSNPEFKKNDLLARPYLDYIDLAVNSDIYNHVEALLGGSVDILVEVPLDKKVAIENAGFQVKSYESLSFNMVAINFLNPILRDYLKLRQAMYYGFNRKSVIDNIYLNEAFLINSPFLLNEFNPPSLNPYNYDLNKAKQLLDECGFTKFSNDIRLDNSGKPLEFTMIYPQTMGDQYRDRILNTFQTDMYSLGIKIKLEALNPDQYLKKLKGDRDYDLAYGALIFSSSLNFSQLFNSKYIGPGKTNFISFSDPNIDKEFNVLEKNITIEEYNATNQKISRRLNYQVPYIFCWTVNKVAAASMRLPNFVSVITPFGFFDYVYELFQRQEN